MVCKIYKLKNYLLDLDDFLIFSKEYQGDKIFVKIRLQLFWTRKMEKSCLDHTFLPIDRCEGCANTQFSIDEAKTPEKK